MTVRLLFVCTGNTCRSPLAAAIAAQLSADRHADIVVGSAGTAAWPDAPASDGSMLVGLERGLDLSAHRARLLTADLIAEADVILAMGPQHVTRALALGGAGRTHLLTAFASNDAVHRAISDPFGGDLTQYRRTSDELWDVVERAVDRLHRTQHGVGP